MGGAGSYVYAKGRVIGEEGVVWEAGVVSKHFRHGQEGANIFRG